MSFIRGPFRSGFKWVVFYLIGINFLVFLAQLKFPITGYIALRRAAVLHGWVWQLATYMFAHGGWQHIIFNMLGLFIFGVQVERRMGSGEFLAYYLVTGTFAGIFSFLVYLLTGTNAILVGASGAVFAVELAFAALYPNAMVYIWGLIPLRAPVMVLGYTALELFFSFTGFRSGVAHSTHLFGFVGGWLYFLIRFRINPWRAFRGR